MKVRIIALIIFCTKFLSAQFADYVNPFIGTDGHGHTFPGPCYPFGMVQLSPDTRLEGWDGCSGYHYSDSLIYGFSHTHLSGTGVGDYCDILIMPGSKKLTKLDLESSYFPSRFQKRNESASPGLYQVFLDDPKIKVKLTTTLRTGLHEYSFNDSTFSWVVIDLKHRDKILHAGFDEKNRIQISGHRTSSSWAKEQNVFFSLKFSQNVSQYIYSNDSLRLFCIFKNLPSNKLSIQCAISSVDIQGAKNNLNAEWMNFRFESTYKNCLYQWNKMLSRIQIKDTNTYLKKLKTIFYTSLYHTLIHPSLYQDADQRYRGMDYKIHLGSKKTPRYTVFSLWDTYRAAHPLYQLIYPEFNYCFAKTFLEQYKECGRLPVWELSNYETYCMIGNHSIPVLANVFLSQTKKFYLDASEVISAMEGTFEKNYSNIKEFKQGYIAMENGAESVSKTIENALDYYAYNLIKKSKNQEHKYYQNLYNPETGFFQPKQNCSFTKIFDPYEVNFNYTEANAWQYLFGAHHDINGMIDCFHRDKVHDKTKVKNIAPHPLERKLDSLFRTSSRMTGREQADITGLLGQYAHGNEPSHHDAYLYNYCNRNDKTQMYVTRIMNNFYTDKADGLCGNEDCGQMSAWYVFSAMGFYPVNPVTSKFQSGFPLFNTVEIRIPGQKKIKIERNNYKRKFFVSRLSINDDDIHSEFSIHSGDQIKFYYDSKNYLQLDPPVATTTDKYIPVPYKLGGDEVFDDSTFLELKGFSPSGIEYSIDSAFKTKYNYKIPIAIKNEGSYYFRYKQNQEENNLNQMQKVVFTKKPVGFFHHTETAYDPQYAAGGGNALFDGLKGSMDFRDGRWQGFRGKDVIVQIKITNPEKINGIKVRCLQDQNSWIILPELIKVFVSNDGYNYSREDLITHNIPKNTNESVDHVFTTEKVKGSKFIELKILNSGTLPDWHISSGKNSWIFIDEIIIY
ncbi:MAG: glycoside hydrolase family 92 protein [Saprospiraceae bacterium]|nr:glycoside hydrolase family 92 protein [Saprospiraceae bacterium]